MLVQVIGPAETALLPSVIATPGGEALGLLWPPLLVLGLCATVLLALRWHKRRTGGAAASQVELTARIELSPQHVLYVVRAHGRSLLLGGAPGGLALLTELPATTTADGIAPRLTRPSLAADADPVVAKERAA